jgi:hypothetical protein
MPREKARSRAREAMSVFASTAVDERLSPSTLSALFSGEAAGSSAGVKSRFDAFAIG